MAGTVDAREGRRELRELLKRYNEQPHERERVAEQISGGFVERRAVLVLDTCGFSRTVRRRGIVHFLALLERLERVVAPNVEEVGGRVLRREADNVFAIFDDPVPAVEAARMIIDDVAAANEALPAEEEVQVSVGIGYGDLIVVGEDDVWGDEMNLASKLGEDLAGPDEILLTPAAHAALGDAAGDLDEVRYSISGLDVAAYRVPTRPREGTPDDGSSARRL